MQNLATHENVAGALLEAIYLPIPESMSFIKHSMPAHGGPSNLDVTKLLSVVPRWRPMTIMPQQIHDHPNGKKECMSPLTHLQMHSLSKAPSNGQS